MLCMWMRKYWPEYKDNCSDQHLIWEYAVLRSNKVYYVHMRAFWYRLYLSWLDNTTVISILFNWETS